MITVNLNCFLLCSLVFLVFACETKETHKDVGPVILLDDLPEPFGAIDNMFSLVEVIALKKGPEAILSFSRVLENDFGIFILDKSSSRLSLFSKSGDFIRDFGKLGGGPGEFASAYDFFIKGNEVFVFSPGDLSLFIYDVNTGQFLNKVPLMAFAQRIELLSDNEILVYVSNNPTDTNFNVYRFDLSGNKLDEYFPFDPKRSDAIVLYSGFLARTNDGVYYCDPFGHKVYRYNELSKDFEQVFELGFVSDYLKIDREIFFQDNRSQSRPEDRVRFVGSLFLKNQEYLLLNMTYDSKVQTAFIDIKKGFKSKIFSMRVDNGFYRFLGNPALLNSENEVVFVVGPEKFQSLKDEEMPISLQNIFDSIDIDEEADLLYLIRMKIVE